MANEVFQTPGEAQIRQDSLTPQQIETALAQARELKTWWCSVEGDVISGKADFECFEIYPASPQAGLKATLGFYAEVPVRGKIISVMGNVTDSFYDRLSVPPNQRKQAARRILKQVEEFALRFWLRNQVDVLPEPEPEQGHLYLPPYLRVFSWTPSSNLEMAGINNVQRSYKTAEGRIGMFKKSERTRIVDLRRLGSDYAWVQLDRQLMAFDVTLGAGDEISLVIPIKRVMPVAMDKDLIVYQSNPQPDVLGAFGPGFALIEKPRGVLAFGPDKLQPGLQLQYLQVLESGEVRLRVVSIMATPEKLVKVSLNPMDWSLKMMDMFTLGIARRITKPIEDILHRLPSPAFDPVLASIGLLNMMTGNLAAEKLRISKKHLLKDFLAKDATGNLQTLLATRQIWQAGPDWLKPDTLPAWVREGGPPHPPKLKTNRRQS